MIKFSVVLPTYNSSSFFYNSVDSLISQTYSNFEVIVVDDGSEDNTLNIIKSYIASYDSNINWIFIQKKHSGPGDTRNCGILNSSGSYIAFLDSDDIWDKDKLQKVANVIKRNNIDLITHYEDMI